MPRQLRVDNGQPWGTSAGIPTALALWLVGLGIEVIYIRPCRSTDNGVVERDHGVLADWVELKRCATCQQATEHLNWGIDVQRNRYPVHHQQARTILYPSLFTNPRTYDPAAADTSWQIDRVYAYLADYVFERRVGKTGQISLFSSTYHVGAVYRSQTVYVQLDAHHAAWIIRDEQGRELKRHPTQEINRDTIESFTLSKRSRV